MKKEHLKEWISRLSDPGEVIRLVQGHLGCACPRVVFEHYQVEIREEDSGPLIQLIVGDRLLLWIMDAADFIISEAELSRILRNGRQERDQRELNRFRLVVEGGFLPPDHPVIKRTMAHFDSRTHIHFLKAQPQTVKNTSGF